MFCNNVSPERMFLQVMLAVESKTSDPLEVVFGFSTSAKDDLDLYLNHRGWSEFLDEPTQVEWLRGMNDDNVVQVVRARRMRSPA